MPLQRRESSGRSRRARMPPCNAGCSVLTRPSIISGESGQIGNAGHLKAGISEGSGRSAGRHQLESRADEAPTEVASPVLSETLRRALGIGDKVQYYPSDAGRAWRRKKAANAAFFFAPAPGVGVGSKTTAEPPSQQAGIRTMRITGKVKWFNNAKGTDSSSATVAATSCPLLGDPGRRIPFARGRPGRRFEIVDGPKGPQAGNVTKSDSPTEAGRLRAPGFTESPPQFR